MVQAADALGHHVQAVGRVRLVAEADVVTLVEADQFEIDDGNEALVGVELDEAIADVIAAPD